MRLSLKNLACLGVMAWLMAAAQAQTINLLAPTQNQILAAGGAVVIGNQGVPMLVPGNGTIAANGVLTLSTALAANPVISSTFVYLTSSAITSTGAGSAAGWYYALFSSTLTSTVYNNTYSGTGTPIIPTSPTAFVTGAGGAYTGVSTAVTAYQLPVAGNTLGLNGGLRVTTDFSYTNNAGIKTPIIQFGGTGLQLFNSGLSTTASIHLILDFKNAGATGNQTYGQNGSAAIGLASSNAVMSAAIDTTQTQTLAITMTNATPNANNFLLAQSTVELLPSVP